MNITRIKERAKRFDRDTEKIRLKLKMVLSESGVLSSRGTNWRYLPDKDEFVKDITDTFNRAFGKTESMVRLFGVGSISYCTSGVVEVKYIYMSECDDYMVKLIVKGYNFANCGEYKYKLLQRYLMDMHEKAKQEYLVTLYNIAIKRFKDITGDKFWSSYRTGHDTACSKTFKVWSGFEEDKSVDSELSPLFCCFGGHEVVGKQTDNIPFCMYFDFMGKKEHSIKYKGMECILYQGYSEAKSEYPSEIMCRFEVHEYIEDKELKELVARIKVQNEKEIYRCACSTINGLDTNIQWTMSPDKSYATCITYMGNQYKEVAEKIGELLPSDIFSVKAKMAKLNYSPDDVVECVEITMKMN